MNKRTAKALEASIAHWKRMKANEMLDDCEEPSVDECPLCLIFNDPNQSRFCEGCPVYESTKRIYCADTPYNDARLAWIDWNHGKPRARAKFRRAAGRMIEFLESLRDPA